MGTTIRRQFNFLLCVKLLVFRFHCSTFHSLEVVEYQKGHLHVVLYFKKISLCFQHILFCLQISALEARLTKNVLKTSKVVEKYVFCFVLLA